MHVTAHDKHCDFFSQNFFIEFEELLTETEALLLQEKQERVIRRQHTELESLPLSFADAYRHGIDLWRQDDEIKKLTFSRQLATLASQLCKEKSLRIACTQIWLGGNDPSHFFPHLSNETSLQDLVACQSLAAGVIICLEPALFPSSEPLHINSFPIVRGHAAYLSPTFPIPFSTLAQAKGGCYLAIAYISQTAICTHKPHLPHSRLLKNLGYSSGDRLKTETHPVLCR
ncbi:hypothetical protein JYU14_01555 [Simkania negevensis]|uniref:Uncharacterized protein n=1 Tax=Simkania negevensis TaxID=83561 RepID=A0ABS3APW8_9BACT|nr:hypothetical protein [Simkania negevensis]